MKDFESVKAMVAALQPSYPVYCLRPEIIAETARRFLDLFPGRVLYALKCNPHPEVLRALYRAGIRHFDTASLPEIAQVRESIGAAGYQQEKQQQEHEKDDEGVGLKEAGRCVVVCSGFFWFFVFVVCLNRQNHQKCDRQ